MQQSGQIAGSSLTPEAIAGTTESRDGPMPQISGKAAPCIRSSQPAWARRAAGWCSRSSSPRSSSSVSMLSPSMLRYRPLPWSCTQVRRRSVGDRDLSDGLCNAGGQRRPARRYPRHQKCISGRRARLHVTSLWCGLAQSGSGLTLARVDAARDQVAAD